MPGTDSEVPVGEALRSGPTGLATQMCHDRRAVDVEALGELGDRRTDGARLDELFYPWRAEAGLLLPHALATTGGLAATIGAISRGRNTLTWAFGV